MKHWIVIWDKKSGVAAALPYSLDMYIRMAAHDELHIVSVNAADELSAITSAYRRQRIQTMEQLYDKLMEVNLIGITLVDYKQLMRRLWRLVVRQTLYYCKNHKEKTAQMLGVSRKTIYCALRMD